MNHYHHHHHYHYHCYFLEVELDEDEVLVLLRQFVRKSHFVMVSTLEKVSTSEKDNIFHLVALRHSRERERERREEKRREKEEERGLTFAGERKYGECGEDGSKCHTSQGWRGCCARAA